MTKVTVRMLENYLKRFGWPNYQVEDEPIEKEGLIHTKWRSLQGDKQVMVIDPMVEVGCLSFRTVGLIEAPMNDVPYERLSELFFAISHINHRIILGKFAYDITNGEVRFSVDIPIDQNTLTYEQFEHAMKVMVLTVEKYVPGLRQIVAGEKTAEQFIAEEKELEEKIIKGALSQLLQDLLGILRPGN